jgi:carnitine O-palmitoyltransferase 1
MASFVVAGGFGAVINCALASYFSSQFDAVQEIFLQPAAALKTLVCGFFGGTLVLLMWQFVKVRMVRYLFQYDGWFLHPKRPINKVWFFLVVALLGRKAKGSLEYQKYLPSYPLPSLKKTCTKYLQSVKPLLKPEEFSHTEKAVEKFLKKDGKRLQLILGLRAFRNRNWINDWWLDYIYLKQRTPICFNSNYYATGSSFTPTHSQLDRAAMILYSSTVFFLQLKKGKITNPRAANLAPFCMEGFLYLHCTNREPGEDIDRLVNYASDGEVKPPTHIVIIRRGKFYKLDVLSAEGKVQTPLAIRRGLEKIMDMAGDEPDERAVASFTALPRTKWAKINQRMREREINRASLDAIGSSLSLIALETEATDVKNVQQQAHLLFYGNGHNRWFDKSVTLSVSSTAVVGADVEHSALDATVAGQMWEYLLTDEEYDENGRVFEPFRNCHSFEVDEPTHLQWDLEGLEEELEQSKANLFQMIADSDLIIMTTYGKEIPKKCKLSPDGWFQMALQLAHYRKYKEIVLTYESATTRLYYKGRTETIRPVTEKSVLFCKAFDDPDAPPEDVKKYLKEAIDLQSRYKLEAMRGLGVDRHLFGLYCVAKGTNVDPLPDLFSDKAFNLRFLLSTSQTPVRTTDRWRLECSSVGGGFGTVTDDGYGVSYLVYEDHVRWSIHSKHSSLRTNSREFASCVTQAMDDMRQLYNA